MSSKWTVTITTVTETEYRYHVEAEDEERAVEAAEYIYSTDTSDDHVYDQAVTDYSAEAKEEV